MRNHVDTDVARAGPDVLAHFRCHVGRPAQRTVAARRLAHIYRVSLAQKFGRDLVRRIDAFSERAEYLDARAKGRQPPARSLRFLADEIQTLGEALGRDHVRHPSVAVVRGAPERTLGPPANPDRRAAGGPGSGLHDDFAEVKIFPTMLDAVAAPEPLHKLDRFGRTPAAFMDRHTAG